MLDKLLRHVGHDHPDPPPLPAGTLRLRDLARTLAALWLVGLTAAAGAHEGHDHDPPPPAGQKVTIKRLDTGETFPAEITPHIEPPPPDPDPEPDPDPDDPPPPVHPDDPAKRDEHERMLALTPTAEATYQAAPGPWVSTDPDARAWVPSGVTQTVAGSVSARWVRVDGTLDVRPGTTLRVEDLIVDPRGRLRIGSPERPVTLDDPVRVTIRDTGPLDPVRDPLLIGRGLISHGSVDVYAETVTPYAGLAVEPKAGDTALTLAGDVTNWRPGHTLALSAVTLDECETATVAAIDGRRVTLAAPLAYSHPTYKGAPPFVACLTRPVTIESESKEPGRRGHIMLMHSPTARLRGLLVKDMGRTRKADPVTDPVAGGDDATRANPRGRYPLHVHRTGPASAVSVSDCVVWGSPGWGIVNHESHLLCDSCVCYDVFGAAFVAENGRERGRFNDFVALKIDGTVGETNTDDTRFGRTHDDWAFGGNGVHILGGGNVLLDGGRIYGVRGEGIIHMSLRAAMPDGLIPMADLDPEFKAIADLGSIWPHPAGMVPAIAVPPRVRNVTVAGVGRDGVGYLPWTIVNPAWQSVCRGDITDCHFAGCSIVSGYTNNTDYVRVTSINDPLNPSGCAFGHTGVVFGHRYIDCVVRGWGIGIQLPSDGVNEVRGGEFENVCDLLQLNKTQPATSPPGRTVTITGTKHLPLKVDPAKHVPTYNGRPLLPGRWKLYLAPWFLWFDLGAIERQDESDWWPNLFDPLLTFGPSDATTFDGEIVVYEEWGRDYPVPSIVPDEYRLNPDGSVRSIGELFEAKGWAFGGRKPVAGERRPGVRGLFLRERPVWIETPVIPADT